MIDLLVNKTEGDENPSVFLLCLNVRNRRTIREEFANFMVIFII